MWPFTFGFFRLMLSDELRSVEIKILWWDRTSRFQGSVLWCKRVSLLLLTPLPLPIVIALMNWSWFHIHLWISQGIALIVEVGGLEDTSYTCHNLCVHYLLTSGVAMWIRGASREVKFLHKLHLRHTESLSPFSSFQLVWILILFCTTKGAIAGVKRVWYYSVCLLFVYRRFESGNLLLWSATRWRLLQEYVCLYRLGK